MISLLRITRSLNHEIRYWQHRNPEQYVKGLINGLKIALEMAKELDVVAPKGDR